MPWNSQPLQRTSPLGARTIPFPAPNLPPPSAPSTAEPQQRLQPVWALPLLGWSGSPSVDASSAHPTSPKQRGWGPSLPARSIPCPASGAHGQRRRGTAWHTTGTPRMTGTGLIGSTRCPPARWAPARPLPPPRAGCAPALRRRWPPASQPFPGNLIAAADELKMHFLPPCCKIFINVRRERSAGSRRPGPQRDGGQRGPRRSRSGLGGPAGMAAGRR